MRVLITGVPGWLGNRFLEILIKGFNGEGALNDWGLRCLVMPGMKLSVIEALSKIKKIDTVIGDVANMESLKKAVEGIDLVYHLVGIIHPQKISQLYEVNTRGTENLLRCSMEAGVKRFIYVSSNSVAGTNIRREVLMRESDPPRPYMHYGLSKYKAECIVNECQKSGKIETVIFRPCWFYGPSQPERQTTFFRMIKKGNPIIFGDGANLRSMSYIDNTCEALVLAAQHPLANGKTYWIADERPYSSEEIYETIAELLEVKRYRPRRLPGFSSEIFLWADKVLQKMGLYIQEVHVAGEMNKDIACSIERAKQELGYRPRIGLREGMKRSIEWCRKNGIEI